MPFAPSANATMQRAPATIAAISRYPAESLTLNTPLNNAGSIRVFLRRWQAAIAAAAGEVISA